MPVHTLDRIIGLPEPLPPSSFAIRSPWWVELAYLCSCSIVTKALTWVVLGFKFLRDGVTLLGSSVHTHVYTVLDRNEGFYLVLSCYVFLRGGVPLLWLSGLTFICPRSERRFSLGFLWLCVPSRWGHPFRVEGSYLCVYSIATKVFTWVCLALCFFTMVPPF